MSEDLLESGGEQPALPASTTRSAATASGSGAIMEAAFSTHRESEPVLFRGCYFLATGAEPHEQAFSAGLFRSPRGRIFADHLVTQWTEEAERDDRHYRRIARGIGLAGAPLTLLVWVVHPPRDRVPVVVGRPRRRGHRLGRRPLPHRATLGQWLEQEGGHRVLVAPEGWPGRWAFRAR